MTDYTDAIDEDPNVAIAEAEKQKQAEMVEQFNEFRSKYPDLFGWMLGMSDDQEERATQKLIDSKKPEDDVIYRNQIAACRYYREWVETGFMWVDSMRTETEPLTED